MICLWVLVGLAIFLIICMILVYFVPKKVYTLRIVKSKQKVDGEKKQVPLFKYSVFSKAKKYSDLLKEMKKHKNYVLRYYTKGETKAPDFIIYNPAYNKLTTSDPIFQRIIDTEWAKNVKLNLEIGVHEDIQEPKPVNPYGKE